MWIIPRFLFASDCKQMPYLVSHNDQKQHYVCSSCVFTIEPYLFLMAAAVSFTDSWFSSLDILETLIACKNNYVTHIIVFLPFRKQEYASCISFLIRDNEHFKFLLYHCCKSLIKLLVVRLKATQNFVKKIFLGGAICLICLGMFFLVFNVLGLMRFKRDFHFWLITWTAMLMSCRPRNGSGQRRPDTVL